MADIQTVTTAGATLIVFGSKAKADINPDTDTGKAFWEDNPGAIVFPTDENKVYFGGVAYDGFDDADLQAALSDYVTKSDLSTALADYVKTENFVSLFTTQLNNQLPNNTKFKAVETQASTNASDISTLDNKVDSLIGDVDALSDALGDKQDKLTAGDGISISADNVISSTLDLTLYKIVSALPSSNPDPTKIYLVKSAESTTNDIYEEYIWTGTTFEKLGEYKSEVDLTPYITSATAENLYLKKALLKGQTVNGTEVAVTPTTETGSDGKPVTYHYISAALIIQ